MNTKHFLGCCFALLFSILLSCRANAQKQLPYLNSLDSISLGIALADTGAYARAVSVYESISDNDTNYNLALIEDAIAKEAMEQDSDAVALCRKGIQQQSEYDPDFYNTLANVSMDEGNYSDAIKLLQDTVLPKYSNVHKLYYTLGLAQYKMHKYADAINSFEKAIDLDLYDAPSHFYLGRCCLEQGRLIPALLSLQFYLVLQPQTNRSYTTVGLIEQMTGNKYQYNKLYQVDPSEYKDSAFTELDLLIRSKIAMNKQYKTTTKINYNFVRQLQLFFEQLKYVPNTGNYWMDKYVPFFTGLQQKKYLEPYIYYMLSSVQDETLQKNIIKNKSKIKEFSNWKESFLLEERSKKDIDADGKKVTVICGYYDNDMLQTMGPEIAGAKKKSELPTGEWTYFYRHTGTISCKGKFNENGERDGKWQWFYINGTKKEVTNFSNGKREGTAELWHENGTPKSKYNFHNDLLDGACWEYNISGILTSRTNYSEGKQTGDGTYFYDDGKQHFTGNFVNGKLEGTLTEYYVNGQLRTIKTMQNDMKNGPFALYWSNGKLEDTGVYKDDQQIGLWKIFYRDGSLHKVGNFNLKGSPEGRWVFYFRNGKTEESQTYNKNGNLDGVDSLFDKDGIVYQRNTYKDGVLLGYTFTDKAGNVMVNAKLEGKNLPLKGFNPEGQQASEGTYVNNKREGEWKFYNYFGVLETVEYYTHDMLDGPSMHYYFDGKLKDSANYSDDSRNGYYVSYNPNSTMAVQGWYIDGYKQGEWDYYDLKGRFIKRDFFVNGLLHGHSDFFEANGKLSEQHFYRYGYLDKIYDYDSNGKVDYKYISDKGTGKYLLKYDNGNPIHELNYVNGSLEGTEKKYYYNGKLAKEGEYLNDAREGTTKDFYENGKLASVYTYDLGFCEGSGNSYYENGNIEEANNYYSDDMDGSYRFYLENGKLNVVGNYVEGDREGEYTYYYGDSNVAGIFWFHDGNIIAYSSADKAGKPVQKISLDKGTGDVMCNYPNGNKSIQCKYAGGYFDGKRISYTPDGKIRYEENYESGNRQGVQKYYFDSDTTLKELDTYYYGELDGSCLYYYKTGKLEHTEEYVLGTRQGPCKYYDKDGNLVRTAFYYDGNEVGETKAK